MLGAFAMQSGGGRGFTTKWTVVGDTTARTITLPLVNTRNEGSLNYNCTVFWGDGSQSTVTAFNDPNISHTYAADGTYNVEIRGICEGWSFSNTGDKLKIVSVVDWGDSSLFAGFTYLAGGFYGCSNLVSIANGSIPASGTGVLYDGFDSTFKGCSFGSIPEDLFRRHPNVSSYAFYSTFSACHNISTIPAGLFRYNTSVNSHGFHSTFNNCKGLLAIPPDLFRYNTALTFSGFRSTFYNCTSLVSVPADLFRYGTLVSTNAFIGTFANCVSLVSIPPDLFRYNTLVSTSAFNAVFQNCPSLASLPADLFRYNVAVSSGGFAYSFDGCTSLVSVPADLFRYNTLVTGIGFYQTFHNCDKLQFNKNIFFADGEESTRFLNKSLDFTQCFQRYDFTGIQGTAPDLWNCNFGTGTPTTTQCFNGTGNSLTSLDNYASIPAEWE
jgi:hypothetical protein